jgi:hypothetical protein
MWVVLNIFKYAAHRETIMTRGSSTLDKFRLPHTPPISKIPVQRDKLSVVGVMWCDGLFLAVAEVVRLSNDIGLG